MSFPQGSGRWENIRFSLTNLTVTWPFSIMASTTVKALVPTITLFLLWLTFNILIETERSKIAICYLISANSLTLKT